MLLKNAQIASPMAVEAINILAQAKIPARAGFVLAQNLSLITAVADLYEKSRVKLVEAHATRDADGKIIETMVDGKPQVSIDPARGAEFNKEFDELLNVDTELAIKKIKLSDIGAVEISTGHLSQILWLIDAE